MFSKNLLRHTLYLKNKHEARCFGLYIDIDGVVSRGKDVLPNAKRAFDRLKEMSTIPYVFLTNSGTTSSIHKAEYLSNLIGQHIKPEQVIMSYKPLKFFKKLFDKNVLICGQGPIKQIAKYLGFNKIVTIEDLSNAYPLLDMVANSRREIIVKDDRIDIPRIEGILLFGEPVNWETAFQLITDVLITDGYIKRKFDHFPFPHIPIIACNADFLWMAQWKYPRFGHGSFLLCLESLYLKLTGRELTYSAVLGKPNILNYLYAEKTMQKMAPKHRAPQTIYAIGDNPDADVSGANLYQMFLAQKMATKRQGLPYNYQARLDNQNYASLIDWAEIEVLQQLSSVARCHSILVETGVYHSALDTEKEALPSLNYNHRNFSIAPTMKKPDFIVKDIAEALDVIRENERNHS